MTNDRSGEKERRSGSRLAVGLTVLGGVARLLPHPANFTPVGAMSLFAGARIDGWKAYLVPLAILAITDPILWLSGATSDFALLRATAPAIYASFLVNVWIGRRLLWATEHPLRIAAAVALASGQFFVVTNGAEYLWGDHTVGSLGSWFLAAVPYFGRTLAGDLCYAAVLFGLQAWLSRRATRPGRAEESLAEASR